MQFDHPYFHDEFENVPQGRGFWGQWHGPRANRGDLAPIILRLLKEKPMHGYEIIRTLEERSHGMWRPSAGSVYPILQLLEEQELVSSLEQNGKKVYALTVAGQKSAEQAPQAHPAQSKLRAGKVFMEMRHVMHDSVRLAKQIAFHGNDEQLKRMKQVLTETHKQLADIVQNPNQSK